MRSTMAVLLTASALLAGGVAQAQQEPRGYQGSVGSAWYEMTLDMPACLAAAGDAMREAGYVVDRVGPREETVFGGRDGTALAVRCIPSRRIAVVFTHSPRGEDMGSVARIIRDHLRGGAPQPGQPSQPAQPPAGGAGSKF